MPKPTPQCSTVTMLSGVATFGFLGWLCWLVTGVVQAGIPEASRAEFAATGLLAATGVALSAIVAAKTADGDPLAFVTGLVSAVKGFVWRK